LTTAPAAAPTIAPSPAARQPRGLAVIFFTEMWERFSYYGMRAILVYYLTQSLKFTRADALAMYGVYTGLVYVTPVFGGWIADKYLGLRRGAVVGAAVMVLGHFAMAVPSLLHAALGLLIVGNGLFKPNTSSMVGELYDGPGDPRRNGGYTIFYMGINLGAVVSPFVCGTLGERYGFHYGFAAAGVGMAIGLATLVAFQRALGGAGLREGQAPVGARDLPPMLAWTAGCVALVWLGLLAWPAVGAVLHGLPTAATTAIGLLMVLGFLAIPIGKTETPAERSRVLALCVLVLFVIFFWMGFEQAGGSMSLFALKQTDRRFGGWEMPASWFQSVNPGEIILFAPLFSILWLRLDRSRFRLSDVAKQGLGMIVLGLGFIVLYLAQRRADAAGPIGPQWLLLVYTLHTLGELMLSPVGLALVSRAAPHRIAGLVMGVWMLSSGVANYYAGTLESLLNGTGIPPYLFLIGSSIGMGVVLLLLTPVLNRMLERRDAGEPGAATRSATA
jgi:POT family proton-dependent oligopeptide transporter